MHLLKVFPPACRGSHGRRPGSGRQHPTSLSAGAKTVSSSLHGPNGCMSPQKVCPVHLEAVLEPLDIRGHLCSPPVFSESPITRTVPRKRLGEGERCHHRPASPCTRPVGLCIEIPPEWRQPDRKSPDPAVALAGVPGQPARGLPDRHAAFRSPSRPGRGKSGPSIRRAAGRRAQWILIASGS
jgi:hypothetical protein